MKHMTTDKHLYRRINQTVPENSADYRQKLRQITWNAQYGRSVSIHWGRAAAMQIGLASLALCAVFIITLNLFLDNFKSRAEQETHLRLAQAYFLPSNEEWLGNASEENYETIVDQLLRYTNETPYF